MTFQFTFENIKSEYQNALAAGYQIITCEEYYFRKKEKLAAKTLVNRVDIDFCLEKTDKLLDLFLELGIKGTFFLRLHAPEYNPFAFKNYRVIRRILESGHELGYHSEVIDQAMSWNEDPADCLIRDIEVINRIWGVKIKGVASHGGGTGFNNLDFWTNRKPSDFGLLYEAYDCLPTFNLFNESFYVSDSEWTNWKCYNQGKLVDGDRRSIGEHARDDHPLMYLLIHPETYSVQHSNSSSS